MCAAEVRHSFSHTPARIDCLQYCDKSRARLLEMRAGGLDAVHITVAYHEHFRGALDNIAAWRWMFDEHADLIMPGQTAADVLAARESGRTAIFFGLQNCAPMENDLRYLGILHQLGVKFMQLTYNQQSVLAGGCFEEHDGGITSAGREVIGEMNRLGMIIDLSHAGEKSVMQAAALSSRPVAITHAAPKFWRESPRHVSDDALRAVAQTGGMFGLSLYPHHLADGSECTLKSFCEMAARVAEIIGAQHLGIGSDLCRGQPDEVLSWMRDGYWRRNKNRENKEKPTFPKQPQWFQSAADFGNIRPGLMDAGFSGDEADGIIGGNWLRFFDEGFAPQQ